MALHLAKIDVPRYLQEKRARKEKRRKRRLWIAEIGRNAATAKFFAKFGIESKIVAMMANADPHPDSGRKGGLKFTLPPSFSIIDSPERTLAALTALASEMRARTLASVFFNFEKLTAYDLGANGLLDVLVEEVIIQARRTGRRIRWRGIYPADDANRRFVKAMGVIKRLKIVHEYPTKAEEKKLTLFDSRCKHYVRLLKPREMDKKSRVTQRFADHINECLLSIGRQLTHEARGHLCQYVGEIIDNAEEHAGMVDWAIQGYLDTLLPIPMCEIVIFNFGQSIADSFKALPSNHYARGQIQKYIEMHKKKGFFQREWREEELYTLIAMQGNVSSKNLSEIDTRGNGSVDLIEFFQQVHNECIAGQDGPAARMAIVSGSTFVLFDGTYKMERNTNGNGIIAFNPANDLNEKPDSKYIRHLDGVRFPGTLISLKFPLLNGNTVSKGVASG